MTDESLTRDVWTLVAELELQHYTRSEIGNALIAVGKELQTDA